MRGIKKRIPPAKQTKAIWGPRARRNVPARQAQEKHRKGGRRMEEQRRPAAVGAAVVVVGTERGAPKGAKWSVEWGQK